MRLLTGRYAAEGTPHSFTAEQSSRLGAEALRNSLQPIQFSPCSPGSTWQSLTSLASPKIGSTSRRCLPIGGRGLANQVIEIGFK